MYNKELGINFFGKESNKKSGLKRVEILKIEGEKGKLNNPINFSIRLKLALVINTQRLSPTKVDNANTLRKKPRVPIITPKVKLSFQLFSLNQHQPNQKAKIP